MKAAPMGPLCHLQWHQGSAGAPSDDRVGVAVPATGGARVRLGSRALDVGVLRMFAHGLVARGVRELVGCLGFRRHR